jgi:hypothetical protein
MAAHETQLGALQDAVLEYTVKHVTGGYWAVCWGNMFSMNCLGGRTDPISHMTLLQALISWRGSRGWQASRQ